MAQFVRGTERRDSIAAIVYDPLPAPSASETPVASGVLTLVRALTTDPRSLDCRALAPSTIEQVLECGLGPVLAHVADQAGGRRHLGLADRVRAADLTARALTAEKYCALADVLSAAREVQCRVVLLKGAATALRYYPAPHLRAMGDLDLLVPANRQLALEARLRALGFRQRSSHAAASFVGRHHSMPFVHPEHDVWIDVHTKLCPRQYPLARDFRFSWPAVAGQLSRIAVGKQTAFAMNHELQLVYTSARWAERFDRERGVHPIVDAALLIRTHGDMLDWDRIVAAVHGSWAATALRLMLSYLALWDLARVPPVALRRLGTIDRHANWMSLALLHRVITTYVIEGQSFGLSPTEGHIRLVWNSLLRPKSPTANLLSIPYHLACPPQHPERFSPFFAMRRVGAFTRRTLERGRRGFEE